jgi:hypothetical protein
VTSGARERLERKRRSLGKAEEVLGRLTIERIRRRWLDGVDRRVRSFSRARVEEEEIRGDGWASSSVACQRIRQFPD